MTVENKNILRRQSSNITTLVNGLKNRQWGLHREDGGDYSDSLDRNTGSLYARDSAGRVHEFLERTRISALIDETIANTPIPSLAEARTQFMDRSTSEKTVNAPEWNKIIDFDFSAVDQGSAWLDIMLDGSFPGQDLATTRLHVSWDNGSCYVNHHNTTSPSTTGGAGVWDDGSDTTIQYKVTGSVVSIYAYYADEFFNYVRWSKPFNIYGATFTEYDGGAWVDSDPSASQTRPGDWKTEQSGTSVFVVNQQAYLSTTNMRGVLTSQSVIPDVDNSRNLGTASFRYASAQIVNLYSTLVEAGEALMKEDAFSANDAWFGHANNAYEEHQGARFGLSGSTTIGSGNFGSIYFKVNGTQFMEIAYTGVVSVSNTLQATRIQGDGVNTTGIWLMQSTDTAYTAILGGTDRNVSSGGAYIQLNGSSRTAGPGDMRAYGNNIYLQNASGVVGLQMDSSANISVTNLTASGQIKSTGAGVSAGGNRVIPASGLYADMYITGGTTGRFTAYNYNSSQYAPAQMIGENIRFYTGTSGSINTMYLSNGNVEVVNDLYVGGAVNAGNAEFGIANVLSQFSFFGNENYNVNSWAGMLCEDAGDVYLQSQGTGKILRFGAGGTEAMRIIDTGDIELKRKMEWLGGGVLGEFSGQPSIYDDGVSNINGVALRFGGSNTILNTPTGGTLFLRAGQQTNVQIRNDGTYIYLDSLPTTDPSGAGTNILWRDAGVLKIT